MAEITNTVEETISDLKKDNISIFIVKCFNNCLDVGTEHYEQNTSVITLHIESTQKKKKTTKKKKASHYVCISMHVLTFCEVASSRSFVFIHFFFLAAFMRRQVLSAVTLHDQSARRRANITLHISPSY